MSVIDAPGAKSPSVQVIVDPLATPPFEIVPTLTVTPSGTWSVTTVEYDVDEVPDATAGFEIASE